MTKTGYFAKRFLPLYSGVKWYLRRAQGRAFPLIANLCVTRRCNFNCRFCYVPRSPDAIRLSTALFEDMVQQLGDMGAYYLYLSGGEPLLVPDIAQWITFAKQRIPFVHLVTNGYLLDEAVAKKLEQSGLDQVSISLDGDEGRHDFLRRQKGAYRQALQALENLRAHAPSIRRVVAAMAAPWNADQLTHLDALCQNHHLEIRFTAHVSYPVVARSPFEAEWRAHASPEARAELSRFLTRFQSRRTVAYDPFLELIPQYYDLILAQKEYSSSVFRRSCHVPLFYLNILDTGEVFSCPGMSSSLYPGTAVEPPLFSMREKRLIDIITGRAYKEKQDELRNCNLCSRYFSSCYVRPRLHFPIGNLLRYRFLPQLRHFFLKTVGGKFPFVQDSSFSQGEKS